MADAAHSSWKARHDLHRAFIGILSRPGDLDDQATELVEAVVRHNWQPPGPVGLAVSRCQNPAGPHPGTALENRRCPTCGWSPFD